MGALMKIVLMAILVFSSQQVFARLGSQCEVAALNAARNGNHHLVITMEGLMGGIHGRAYDLATSARSASGSNYAVQAYSHAGGPSLAVACVNAWKKVHGNSLRLTLIGHSLGGGAVIDTANRLAASGVKVQDLVIFDGREGHEVACGDAGYKYSKPSNVISATAFYQCGFMPGRSFNDGPGVRNIKMDAGPFAHVGLPGTSTAKQVVQALLSKPTLSPTVEVADTNITEPAPVPVGTLNAEEADGEPVVEVGPPVAAASADSKAQQPAWCFKFGARYRCTYEEATRQQYEENHRGP